MEWSKLIPINVTCFVWRAAQRRIPSALALAGKWISVETSICSSCIGKLECANRLLINCPFAKSVREKIFNWSGLNKNGIHNMGDLVQLATSWGQSTKKT